MHELPFESWEPAPGHTQPTALASVRQHIYGYAACMQPGTARFDRASMRKWKPAVQVDSSVGDAGLCVYTGSRCAGASPTRLQALLQLLLGVLLTLA